MVLDPMQVLELPSSERSTDENRKEPSTEEPVSAPVERLEWKFSRKLLFQVRRTVFREWALWFKKAFKRFSLRSKPATSKNEMEELLSGFARDVLKIKTSPPLLDCLNTLVHAHRYRKQDAFTAGLDFTTIRDVVYSYSIEA